MLPSALNKKYSAAIDKKDDVDVTKPKVTTKKSEKVWKLKRGYKKPSFSARVHLPAIPGSFVFRKNGKWRLDQQLQKYCVSNNSIGVFEVKVDLSKVAPKHIDYDAKENGIYIDTSKDQKKYQLFVPYPNPNIYTCDFSSISNSEASYFCGTLSCKIPIVKVNKKLLKIKRHIRNKKKTKKTTKNKNNLKRTNNNNEKMSNSNSSNTTETSHKEDEEDTKSNDSNDNDTLNNSNNSNEIDSGVPPPNKKRRLLANLRKDENNNTNTNTNTDRVQNNNNNNSNISNNGVEKVKKGEELSRQGQNVIAEMVLDKWEATVQDRRNKEVKRDLEMEEYQRQKADKKKLKQAKKDALRQKFLDKREKKANKNRKIRLAFQKPKSGKHVSFDM